MSLLKLLLIPLLVICVFMLSSSKIYASNALGGACNNSAIANSAGCTGLTKGNSDANNGTDPVISTIKTAIRILSYLIGIAAVITIVVSGFRIVMSEGKSENLNSARSAIIFAVVGIIIAIIAQLIIAFVLDKIR